MSAPSSTSNSSMATPSASAKHAVKAFPTPSFVSPEPHALTAKEHLQRTLSGGQHKKKRKLDRELQLAANDKTSSSNSISSHEDASSKKKHKSTSSSSIAMPRLTPQQQLQRIKLKMKMKAAAVQGVASAPSSSSESIVEKKAKKALTDISNKQSENPSTTINEVPQRKLDFTPTPDKDTTKASSSHTRAELVAAAIGPVTVASSESSSSESEDSSSESGYSSDECEVSFDAITLGNTRIVREAESPFSTASSVSSTASLRPVGLEYRFSVSSTVSSIAVAPNGQFLVVGFSNGMIYLYPLTKDSFRFRGGVLLDHITARGMYTQLMVRVAIPEDGKFIFAGVYRGSTDIRAFEVDSIKFPPTGLNQKASSSKDADESDDEHDGFGAATAHAISHTYSDAKLKGFGAVKSIFRSSINKTEYHLLCGLGIKNLHLWRFFQRPNTSEWSWECIFDKTANGISLEYLSFHPSVANQIISKSEHQNIRIWTLEEEAHDDDFASLALHKVSHVDVKNTVDMTAVYGEYAYGGSESLALIDLRSASRMELDLPLSTKEQQAQQDAAAATKDNARITASLMRPRNSRRRGTTPGAEDLVGGTGMRHMRTVSQVAGREKSPFTVGMCSDGSVFFHKPQAALGMATPLEYVEGYERFFQDPSLSFQAQFSDLTRVNTSGQLAVLPLPATEKEDWMIVAANQDQLLVRSLKAFLCRNEQIIEHARVKRGLKNVLRDLGGADSSSSSSSSSSESESDEEGFDVVPTDKQRHQKNAKSNSGDDKETSRSASSPPLSSSSSLKAKEPKDKVKPKAEGEAVKREKPSVSSTKTSDKWRSSNSAVSVKKEAKDTTTTSRSSIAPLHESSVQSVGSKQQDASPMPLVVTTPKRQTKPSGINAVTRMPSMDVASPVVSISSLSSGTSNPNTPEPSKLTQREKQLLVLKDLEWTPPPKAASSNRSNKELDGQERSTNQRLDQITEDDDSKKSGNNRSSKAKSRTKTLFSTIDDEPSATTTPTTSTEPTTKKPKKEGQLQSGKSELTSSSIKDASNSLESSVRTDKAAASGDADNQTMNEKTSSQARDDTEDVEMEDGEVDEDDELDELEANEPMFVMTPLVSDGGSLLSAVLFQYAPVSSRATVKHVTACSPSSADDASVIATTDEFLLNEQTTLLLQFAAQNERLKRSFDEDKARIYQQHDCACSSTNPLKKDKKSSSCVTAAATCSTAASAPRMNWKKSLSSEFLKRKQLKRRQKKQIALQLRQLHGNYRTKIHELLAMQKLEASALTARQRFQQIYDQHVRSVSASAAAPSSSPAVMVGPEKEEKEAPYEPSYLSISFPYPSLLVPSSASSS